MLKPAMLKPECHEILGLPMPAYPAEIERAYRRILEAVHPDSDRLRIATDAYETLRDLKRRPGRSFSAEPPRQTAPLTVPNDFLTVRPSLEELMDHIAQNFLPHRSKSGGPYRKLDVETFLKSEDARFGCRLPIVIEYGFVESAKRTVLEIPPGARDGQRYEVDLSSVGITNIMMQVRIILH